MANIDSEVIILEYFYYIYSAMLKLAKEGIICHRNNISDIGSVNVNSLFTMRECSKFYWHFGKSLLNRKLLNSYVKNERAIGLVTYKQCRYQNSIFYNPHHHPNTKFLSDGSIDAVAICSEEHNIIRVSKEGC